MNRSQTEMDPPFNKTALLGRSTKYAATDGSFHKSMTHPKIGLIVGISESKESTVYSRDQPYDKDAADLANWTLKLFARFLLWEFETREKKRKCEYQEIAEHYTLIETRRLSCRPMKDPYVVDPNATSVQDDFSRKTRLHYHSVPGVFKQAAVFRVVNCGRSRINMNAPAEVWKSDIAQRVTYHNLQYCGSVWTCPCCSVKINLGRQRQIKNTYEIFSKQDQYDVLMVTLTIKHGFSDSLEETLSKLKEADRKFLQKSYFYAELRGTKRGEKLGGLRSYVPSIYDFVGKFSATEITYGNNGWHPHSHQLWFFDRRLKEAELNVMRAALFGAWSHACSKVGLPNPIEFVIENNVRRYVGVDIRRALSAESYLTKFGRERKWAPEKELASSHSKKSKRGGVTPFELLAKAAKGDPRSGGLFKAYAHATLGRHQIETSASLKKKLVLLGLDELEKSDEQLANEMRNESRLIHTLGKAEFDALINLEKFSNIKIEPFGQVLSIIKKEGAEAAIEWIRALPSFGK